MGLYDRDYTRSDFQSHYRGSPQMRLTFPRPTPVVKRLLIINIAVFFLQILGADGFLTTWFSVFPGSAGSVLQIWRLVSYQFLHGSVGHILFNMIGLYFLGPTLEKYWSGRRFLVFYLSCGAAGAVFYILLALLEMLPVGPMIGASGAILGMLAACAILFPHFVVFFFLFPVPIRVAAVILIFLYVVNIITAGPNAGGDAAHLAGMAAGAFYVLSKSYRTRLFSEHRSRSIQKKAQLRFDLQKEVDRILQKVHKQGIHSLTRNEKKILQQASSVQQMKDKI